jgi:PAS domain S-box-containing protein
MFFPYFELAASLFILLLAFQIWTRHYENKLARFYSRFALLAFFASIFTYSLRIAFTLELAQAFNRLSATLWAFLFAMYLHFVLIFTKKERFLNSPYSLLLIYGPPSLIGLLFIFTNWMYQRHEIQSIGIVSQPAPLYSLFMLETFFFCLLGIILLVRYARFTPQKNERIQATLIAIGSVIPVAVGVVTDQFLPLIFGHRVTPPTVVFDIALMNLFIFIAMRNYSLFAISPALAADAIIETMPDSLVVTDLGGRIIFLNEEAKQFFHCPEAKIVGSHIKDLFQDKDQFYKLYVEVSKPRQAVERFHADLVNPLGENIRTSINAKLIYDKLFSEKLGIVFIIRDLQV